MRVFYVLLTRFPSENDLGNDVRCGTESLDTIVCEAKLYSQKDLMMNQEITIWENDEKLFSITHEERNGWKWLIVYESSLATDESRKSVQEITKRLEATQ